MNSVELVQKALARDGVLFERNMEGSLLLAIGAAWFGRAKKKVAAVHPTASAAIRIGR